MKSIHHQLLCLIIYSSFQFNLSAAGNCQGAPLFSTFENIIFSSVGAADCSITKYLLKSIIIDKGSIFTGHSCTQALQVLQQANEPVEIVLYLKDPLSEDALKKILQQLGVSAIDLVRKNETIWKENYKSKTLTDVQLITAMVNNPKLIERPIAIKNGKAVIGRPPQEVLKVL